MAGPRPEPEPAVASGVDQAAAAPRADLHDAVGWTALGTAVLVGSIAMDRLEAQHINPFTVPGLLPGLLGLAMILLGTTLGVRSLRQGGWRQRLPAADDDRREQRRRVWIAIALCVGYGVVLVGHGLPFWLASSVYVTASVLVFRRLSRDPAERRLDARAWLQSIAIGVASSVVTWLVFEKLFLVRLP